MKRIFCICLSILLLFALAIPVIAHSGRTDSSGGHYDHSSGEYHYHHGESAHQHPTGVCPYDVSGKILGTILIIILAIPTIWFLWLLIRVCTGGSSTHSKKEDHDQ